MPPTQWPVLRHRPGAMDHLGWGIIDGQRMRKRWPPVAQMGLFQQSHPLPPTCLATLASPSSAVAPILNVIARNMYGGRASEAFNQRQPKNIGLAGVLGLGTFDREKIWYRLGSRAIWSWRRLGA